MKDTQPNGELANQCVTASCLTHKRPVWTGGDSHEWRHADNNTCQAARQHSAACTCWECQGDPFAGIPQADELEGCPVPLCTISEPHPTGAHMMPRWLADDVAAHGRMSDGGSLFFRADGTRRPASIRGGYQADLFDVATTELVAPGINGVLF
jgi:hypothetical protein